MGNANTASNWISEVRWDEQGRPYRVLLMPTNGQPAGTRTYLAPIEAMQFDDPKIRAWGESNQRPGQSLFRDAGRWNPSEGQWDRGVNWTNVANLGVGAFLAGPAIANAIGGGGPAAASQAGSAGPLTNTAATAPAIYGPASVGGSQAVSAGVGAGTGAAVGGVQPTTPAVAGGSLADKVKQALTSGQGIAALAGVAPLLAGALGGGGSNDLPPELSRVLAINEARMRRADPLHEAAVQLAFQGLPTYGREGISLPRVPLP